MCAKHVSIKIFVGILGLFLPSIGKGEGCSFTLAELSPGVHEIVFPEVRIKFESGRSMIKMKMLGVEGIGDDWTSIDIIQGSYSRISGFRKKGTAEHLIAELIGTINSEHQFEWSAFIAHKIEGTKVRGVSYFLSRDEKRCKQTSLSDWVTARKNYFGEKYHDTATVRSDKNLPF